MTVYRAIDISIRQVEDAAGHDVALDLRGAAIDRRAPHLKERRRHLYRPEFSHDRLFRSRMAACRFYQQVIERLQKLGAENLDNRRFRPRTLLLIGELHRMAEERRQRRDIDTGGRKTVLERRIGDDPGG